jgi:gas vesicle protein
MLAPKSGKKTRDTLRRRAREGAAYVNERGGEIADRAADLMERGARAVRDQKENLAGVAEAMTSRL